MTAPQTTAITDPQAVITALRAERDAAMAREAALAEVLDAINQSPDNPASVFKLILRKSHELCRADIGALVTYDGEVMLSRASLGLPEGWMRTMHAGFAPTAKALRDLICGAHYIHHPDARAAYGGSDDPLVRGIIDNLGVQTVLLVALRRHDRFLGFISAHRREMRPYSEREITLLQNFADQAVIAIENTRLINEQREALEQQTATGRIERMEKWSCGLMRMGASRVSSHPTGLARKAPVLSNDHGTAVSLIIGDTRSDGYRSRARSGGSWMVKSSWLGAAGCRVGTLPDRVSRRPGCLRRAAACGLVTGWKRLPRPARLHCLPPLAASVRPLGWLAMSETKASDPTGKPPDRRKLVAVVYADMVGYSRLIGLDDIGTLERLRVLRANLIDPAIEEHGGRIVQTGGDSLLIVFDSIDGAVRCAVKVQQKVPDYDGDHPPDRAVRFRVGINVGDVIPDGTDVHGDVVNVAARLQAECPPGGICVSRQVRDHVHDRLDLAFEELGPLNLKNIARPVEAFVVRPNSIPTAPNSAERSLVPNKRAPPLPDRPSIAVLAFANMSGDPEQEYFADGIVEEIITGLSRIPSFFVIARNSSFAYKGKSPDVRKVGQELGVRYVLEGSVRKAGARVRIAGQLVDTTNGAHLWADRFEGDLTDIFQLQDKVTVRVVGAIEPRIRMAEIERALCKPTENLEAYDLVLRGRWAYEPETETLLEESAGLLRSAIALDPNYALAYALLARTLWVIAANHWTRPSEHEFAEYVSLAKRAVQLGRTDPEALCIAAYIIAIPGGAMAEGIAIADRSLAQNPNSAEALAISGILHAYSGDTETALHRLEQANRLSPLHVRVPFRAGGFLIACFVDGDYAGVVDWTTRALQEQPNAAPLLRYRAAALGILGRLDEARQTVDRLLGLHPKLTVSQCRWHVEVGMKNPFKRRGVVDAYYEGLRLAGLPE